MDVKALLTSKTMLGIAGSLAVTLATGGDLPVSLTVKGVTYDLGNVAPYVVSAMSALAAYGRLVAAGPILNPKPAQAEPVADGPKGFPRA